MTVVLETKLGPYELIQVTGDLPEELVPELLKDGVVGIDTETTGLDWQKETLALVQVVFPRLRKVYLIRPGDEPPRRVKAILEADRWVKVFHYAMFDLSFLCARWEMTPTQIRCTKIASKLLFPERNRHSLAGLLEEHLEVTLDKDPSIRVSDWMTESISEEQLRYAALDAVYLPALYDKMSTSLQKAGRTSLATRSFAFIPSQLEAQFLGIQDLFGY